MRKTFPLVLAALIAFTGLAVAEDGEYTDPAIQMDSRLMPDYPPAALAAGFEGVVSVAAVINTDGSVGAVEVIEDGNPHLGFGDAAVQAIKNWQFHSARVDGVPVDSVGAFVFRFNSIGRVDPSAYVAGDFILSRAIGDFGLAGKLTRNGGGFSPASHVKKAMQLYKKPPAKPYSLYDRRDLIPVPRRTVGVHPKN